MVAALKPYVWMPKVCFVLLSCKLANKSANLVLAAAGKEKPSSQPRLPAKVASGMVLRKSSSSTLAEAVSVVTTVSMYASAKCFFNDMELPMAVM
eukprot:2161102-Amphidinium_carterae.1